MQAKLTKPWGPYAAGTVVADNKAEAEAASGLHVNASRFALLHDGGYFETERAIPAEVKTATGPFRGTPHAIDMPPIEREPSPPAPGTSAPIKEGPVRGGRHDAPPVTPRLDRAPAGQDEPPERKDA